MGFVVLDAKRTAVAYDPSVIDPAAIVATLTAAGYTPAAPDA